MMAMVHQTTPWYCDGCADTCFVVSGYCWCKQQVEEIDLFGTELEELPELTWNQTQLKTLNLYLNNFTRLPREIGMAPQENDSERERECVCVCNLLLIMYFRLCIQANYPTCEYCHWVRTNCNSFHRNWAN
jgi:hypothetical protein